jgi:hypothetical protein
LGVLIEGLTLLALVAGPARLISDRRNPAKTGDTGSISCKNALILARIPLFSPRFNRRVASWAGVKRAQRVFGARGKCARKTRIKSERKPPPRCF